ncbi:MAG: helix-turn-helix transcriptional regulator [Rhodospirillaceae bacterium]|nr:helix-turn-helix transcriptional regulator [Rhodospirillaceae bacterium]MYB15024.1 helix-turn-helix transcriptional regulator [Rhodospirillaceae bacterium]MYI47927.1 helix-turn-helix transcriptional regulator [Rhodospirillaceae bacterium]
MTPLQRLGTVVRAERTKRGLSQEALAELSGLSRTHIGEIERGEVSVSFVALEAIAYGLGVALSELSKNYEEQENETN